MPLSRSLPFCAAYPKKKGRPYPLYWACFGFNLGVHPNKPFAEKQQSENTRKAGFLNFLLFCHEATEVCNRRPKGVISVGRDAAVPVLNWTRQGIALYAHSHH